MSGDTAPPVDMTNRVLRCPDCGQVLLIVMDPDDPGLPAELAVKVDGHRCDEPGGCTPT